jgi:hypothetical protein
MAVPVMRWIGERISVVQSLYTEDRMGPLFGDAAE